MSRKKKQISRVIRYLTEIGPITRVSALRYLGIANLTAVISDIRKLGTVDIVTNRKKSKNMYGETVYYAEYTIREDTQEEINQ